MRMRCDILLTYFHFSFFFYCHLIFFFLTRKLQSFCKFKRNRLEKENQIKNIYKLKIKKNYLMYWKNVYMREKRNSKLVRALCRTNTLTSVLNFWNVLSGKKCRTRTGVLNIRLE